jgi:flagellar motor switch protein FliN
MDENSTTEVDEDYGTAMNADSRGGNHQDLILSLPVSVQVVLGSATMSVAELMKLGRGAVITLDQHVGDTVNIMVSGRLVARGEVVVLDETDSRFGVSLTEVVGVSGNRLT